jgi:hypothetical protein
MQVASATCNQEVNTSNPFQIGNVLLLQATAGGCAGSAGSIPPSH